MHEIFCPVITNPNLHTEYLLHAQVAYAHEIVVFIASNTQ